MHNKRRNESKMKKLWIYLVFVSIVSSLFLAVSVQAEEAIIQDKNDQKMTLIIKKENSSDGNEPIPSKKIRMRDDYQLLEKHIR